MYVCVFPTHISANHNKASDIGKVANKTIEIYSKLQL